MTAPTEADMDALVARMREEQDLAHQMVVENPDLPYLTAIVMAGDQMQMRRTQRLVEEGALPADARALAYVGSYSRIEMLFWMRDKNLIDGPSFLDLFATWWAGSDPDDTDPRMLRAWKQVKATLPRGVYWRNDDGRTLPEGKAIITVYRGQKAGDQLGCAWTTDIAIAKKFAVTGGGRAPIKDGVVLKGNVAASHVLAFITERGESEVIVDPYLVR